jgi:hypothetical protein
MRKASLSLFVLILLITSVIPMTTAKAVFGGVEAVGSKFVVPIFRDSNYGNPWCSGALIESDVVVSAAHCFGLLGTSDESIQFPISSLSVGTPGLDGNKSKTNDIYLVKYAIFPDKYENYFDSTIGDWRSQSNDIIFFVLKEKMIGFEPAQIASEKIVESAKINRTTSTFFGYGPTLPNIPKDGKPYALEMFASHPRWPSNHPADSARTIYFDGKRDVGLCGGDSGGPWYIDLDSSPKILAVTIGSNGCGPTSEPINISGTLIFPYIEKFQIKRKNLESIEIVENARIEKLLKNGFKITSPSGCYSNLTTAQVQIKSNNVWVAQSAPTGWDLVANCPDGLKYQPWVALPLSTGTSYRWVFKDPASNWETISEPLIFESKGVIEEFNAITKILKRYKTDISKLFKDYSVYFQQNQKLKASLQRAIDYKIPELASQSEIDSIQGLIGGVSGSALASDYLLAQDGITKYLALEKLKSKVTKKSTITCTKGKVTKKVTAVGPKCPAGYKKK